MAKKYLEFISFRFNFIPAQVSGMSDVLTFVDDSDIVWKVLFPPAEGWYKSVQNTGLKVAQDYIIGFVADSCQSFAIVQGDKRIEYVKRAISPDNIIF